jgi:starch phosphorylase
MVRVATPPHMIAYFSLEVGVDPAIPTYSGGLGILAGDTLRSAADLGIPLIGITLLYRKGYFSQRLDSSGTQSEAPCNWSPEKWLTPLAPIVDVTIEGRTVHVRAWRYLIHGESDHSVPLYFLDTGLPENTPFDQALCDYLYGGDDKYRLCQLAILGIGGVLMLREIGHQNVELYHMNEGQATVPAAVLMKEEMEKRGESIVSEEAREAVRQRCIFTTHTPVPAAHLQFPQSLVQQVFGNEYAALFQEAGCCTADSRLNMTLLGLLFSRYVNGVAMRHGEVSRGMFPSYPINSITNGVHAVTWTSEPFRNLYDRHIPEWRRDNLYLRYAVGIPADEIQHAHSMAKIDLLTEIKRRTGVTLDPLIMTIGFARRSATYKRADLMFSNLERLKHIVTNIGPLQLVYAGKAHPQDEGGKMMIKRVFEAAATLKDYMQVIYLEDYDMALAKYICSGVDVWLNTPQKPQEASGTSGMKAAMNGIPSLSVLDGWWIEGHVEGVTGWSIGESWTVETNADVEARSLYGQLEYAIMPMFYGRPAAFAKVMRSSIVYNGSFFNAQRMISQYLNNAYLSME